MLPRKRAVFDSFLAVLSPPVAIFKMINLTLCHKCYSCYSLLTPLPLPLLLLVTIACFLQLQPIYITNTQKNINTNIYMLTKTTLIYLTLHHQNLHTNTPPLCFFSPFALHTPLYIQNIKGKKSNFKKGK